MPWGMTMTPQAAAARKPRPSRRPGGFQPPHCPNPLCQFHDPNPDWHFIRCGRQFSAPTFATTYWLKRPELLPKVAALITEGAGLRQAGRVLGASPSTIARMAARLGRHSFLFHQKKMAEAKIQESLVIDGFETFEYSQFFPYHINLAVGSASWFLYHFTDSPLRRKGRMTPEQKKTRARLEARVGRPDPKAVQKGIASLLRPLLGKCTEPVLRLHSDDHPAYRRALRQLTRDGFSTPRIEHWVTSSKERRTLANPLFPVNLADLLLRHGSANHRRETIAFSKRRREKDHPQGETAAMRAGVADRVDPGVAPVLRGQGQDVDHGCSAGRAPAEVCVLGGRGTGGEAGSGPEGRNPRTRGAHEGFQSTGQEKRAGQATGPCSWPPGWIPILRDTILDKERPCESSPPRGVRTRG